MNQTLFDFIVCSLSLLRLRVTQKTLQLPFFLRLLASNAKLCDCLSFFSSLFPSCQCFRTDLQKLFSNFCQIAAFSACDQDRS